MNIKQMKETISKFRAADVSIIKDEKLRAKAQKLQAKQGGFTLLELLIVITLIATLATAALVAYDGIGESAEETATAANILAAQSLIQNYRAIENNYPNQWDNLANADGSAAANQGTRPLLDDKTESFLGQWAPTLPASSGIGGSVFGAVAASLDAVGINEFQTLPGDFTVNNAVAVPNLSWNESAPGVTSDDTADELEFVVANGVTSDVQYDGSSVLGSKIALSIVPSAGKTDAATPAPRLCTAEGASISTFYDGTTTAADNQALNLINDALDDDVCSLVIAVGFGKDVPGTTLGSKVSITNAPTAATDNVNPAEDYARYIALFQVAEDTSGDGTITTDEVLSKARLISVVDPEGGTIDQALAGANEES
jgi:prepilin-type N-terminal cleavage/methylation domain-containing protein